MFVGRFMAMQGLKAAMAREVPDRVILPFFEGLQNSALQDADEVAEPDADGMIAMPFLHNMDPDIKATWDLSDFDPSNPNDEPNQNIKIMALILATNAESTVGLHAWSLVEYSLRRLGFTNVVHRNFELSEQVNHPAMAFGIHTEKVAGKSLVACVCRGSSSFVDFISDGLAEPGGFEDAGVNATNALRAYCASQGLTKENTILFICGHSYGASTASLVGISSTDLAERDSIFCYSYATPNYIRHGMTGEGMKMFSFNSNEDVVPQVPVGPNLDKTGKVYTFDRLDLELNHPDQYARFLRLYKHYRDCDYDKDSDYLPDAYTFKPYVKDPVNVEIIRNHMPYTYMPFLLCELTDEVMETYIVDVPSAEDKFASWTMYVGEVYRLPLTGPGLFSWESSNAAVVNVNKMGMVSAKAAGEAILTLTSPNEDQMKVKVSVLDA